MAVDFAIANIQDKFYYYHQLTNQIQKSGNGGKLHIVNTQFYELKTVLKWSGRHA
jgi:hypothetical protein